MPLPGPATAPHGRDSGHKVSPCIGHRGARETFSLLPCSSCPRPCRHSLTAEATTHGTELPSPTFRMQKSSSVPARARRANRALDEMAIVRPTSRAGVPSWNARETPWPAGPGKTDVAQLPDLRRRVTSTSHPDNRRPSPEKAACARRPIDVRRLSRLFPREEEDFEPIVKSKLWKLNANGDRMQKSNWLLRDIWISKTGSMVYWSSKHDCELVLYSAADLDKAKIVSMQKPIHGRWVFRVELPSADGLGWIPGEFASESHELRARWLTEFGATNGNEDR